MDFVGRTLVGKYRVEKLLGQGGMGSVWRGTHTITGRKIAVKILDDKFLSNANVVQRFGREARAASSIAHEGIVEVLDLDQTDEGIPFLVMEFLEGESLAHRIDYGERMTEEQVVSLGAQLLDALHAAHESGVVHRDLKPDNIYVVPGRRGEAIKILDFGISWKSDEQDAKLTVTGSVLGTPHYMSPEQAMGDSDTDRRVDIYAAGVVLYECIVGTVPFEGANYNKLLRVILDSNPTPPSKRGVKISPAVEAVILKALSKRKEDRPRSAAEMRQMLLRAAKGEDVVRASNPGPPPSLTAPADDSVAARWLEAGLEAEPRSRSDIALPREARSRPDIALPRADTPRRSGPQRAPGSEEPMSDGPSPHSLEIDERALERKGPPSGRQSLPRMPAVTAGARTSSASLPAVTSPSSGDVPRPSPAPVQPVVSATVTRAPISPAPPMSMDDDGEPSPFVRWALVAVAALCAVGLIAFAFRTFVSRPGSGTPTTASAPPPSTGTEVRPPTKQPPGAAFVDLTILIEPEGLQAHMRLDGIPGATSPIRVRRGTHHVLEVSAPGYEDQRVELHAERDQRVRVSMRRGT